MPVLTVSRRYHFEAAHFLPFVRDGHKCKNMHGHNYEIEVVLGSVTHQVKPGSNESEAVLGHMTGADGFIMDFWDMDKIVDPILARVDHRVLNDIGGLSNPTAENICHWFFDQIEVGILHHSSVRLVAVTCWETKDCQATWRCD